MARRKRKPAADRWNPSAAWTRSTSWVAPSGRRVEAGTELSIVGERGRFRFVEHVLTPAGAEWISVVGGPRGVRTWRAFRPERVKRVHRLKATPLTGTEAIDLVRQKKREKRATR